MVKLRSFETADIRELHRWSNDSRSILMVGRTPLTYEQVLQEVEGKRRNNDLLLGIENEEQQLVGWVFLKDIDHGHGRASIGILLAPEARGKGYGKIAMEQMIDVGFKQLRLNKIYLTTRGTNEQAIGLYKKIGFTVEGKLRQHAYVDGQYLDTYFMGILASEWGTQE
ncbi:Protein N-acetyltransferase, RimJ/RimL family [Fictibacillus enclensis]|uniref:GNAT family acetyltransferase n=1 Tax=Fictibacillus enclensis TaxID=1017270 RepID=A0A0V8J251_9BACL|nr:GNAT family protein [Fictibacillus enclensis]KSU81118.1 GNAT family acetyltransferase [Fictibacillus enclensis]SCC35238.1 Protein N-acetyltransferase, RimJ/RimL family [Fictibacillus enclensis]